MNHTPTQIPEDWKIVKLEEICEKIKSGGTPLTTRKEYYGGNIPFVKIEDITVSGKYLSNTAIHITEEGLNSSNAWLVPENSLLLAIYGSIGSMAINKIPVSTNQAILGIIPGTETITEYLYYSLVHSKKRMLRQRKQSTQANLTAKIVKDFKIPLPPLPQQRKIAEILGSVDSAIQQVDEAIAKAERLKKGLMQDLLTKGIGHTDFKDTEIGRIPEEWEVVRLGDVGEGFQYGLSIKMSEEGQYPIIKMDSLINGEVQPVNLRYVNLDENTFQKYRLEKGDILINRTNSYELVGRSGIFMLDGDYVFASYLIRIKPDKKRLFSKFMAFYLLFSLERLRKMATRAVSQANINASNLRKFKLPLPPLSEQKKIAEILSTVDEKIALEKERKAKLERVKKGLMNDLLTGKKRVKIDEKEVA